jgi:hypothetical protein
MRGGIKGIAGLLSIGAGIYLLSKHGTAISIGGQSGQSWFEVLAHGIGIYFIARGVWMLGHLGEGQALTDRLDKLIEFEAHAHTSHEHEPDSGSDPTFT